MKKTFGQKIFDNLLTMFADEKFRNEVMAIKEKFHIPEAGIDDDYKNKYGKDNIGYCFMDLDQLRVKYKLNQHYGIFLMYAVIFSKTPDKEIIDLAQPFELFYNTENSGLKCAAIKIYSETTLEDIIVNWPQIEKFKETTYGRKIKHLRPFKNAKRDLTIRALKRWGKNNKYSASVINAVYPQLNTIGYEDIPKIIKKNKTKAAELLKITNKNK